MQFLEGKKTHILVLSGLVAIIASFLTGDLALGEAIQRALEVASMSALRMGVKAA